MNGLSESRHFPNTFQQSVRQTTTNCVSLFSHFCLWLLASIAGTRLISGPAKTEEQQQQQQQQNKTRQHYNVIICTFHYKTERSCCCCWMVSQTAPWIYSNRIWHGINDSLEKEKTWTHFISSLVVAGGVSAGKKGGRGGRLKFNKTGEREGGKVFAHFMFLTKFWFVCHLIRMKKREERRLRWRRLWHASKESSQAQLVSRRPPSSCQLSPAALWLTPDLLKK